MRLLGFGHYFGGLGFCNFSFSQRINCFGRRMILFEMSFETKMDL